MSFDLFCLALTSCLSAFGCWLPAASPTSNAPNGSSRKTTFFAKTWYRVDRYAASLFRNGGRPPLTRGGHVIVRETLTFPLAAFTSATRPRCRREANGDRSS